MSRSIKTLPLIPLRDLVVFPHAQVPLYVGREKSIAALDEAVSKGREVLLAAQKKARTNDPTEEEIFEVGTVALIREMLRLPDGTAKVLVEGRRRARILKFLPSPRYFLVEVEEVDDHVESTPEVEALVRSVVATFDAFAKLNPKVPPEMLVSIQTLTDPSMLADTVAGMLNLKMDQKEKLLEALDPADRLEKVFGYMQGEIEVLQLERRIKARVKKQMERTQKEYYLNEQMKAIQKELGEKDEFKSEIQELEEKLKQKKMSAEAQKKVKAEIKKLKLMSPMSAEATVVRNYVDWILSLPWNDKTEEKLDLGDAERILEEDHYGLKQVKERILEYLAVRALVKKMKSPILCFVGPPGVGKTSLAKSIARATGRKFVRVSLGGVRDEAEIRGHRRTYIGALPGKIVQCMKRAGSNNPVFLLDEVDKMSTDFRGDPSAALLEVLDPEQNHAFQDHYLDLDYDLSDVMFITTANTLHPIPPPLQDRMEVIRIPGYTDFEKLHIAKRFLIPKQLEAHGLTPEHLEFSDRAVIGLIRGYTREAGVRNLERELATVVRKVAKEVVKARGPVAPSVTAPPASPEPPPPAAATAAPEQEEPEDEEEDLDEREGSEEGEEESQESEAAAAPSSPPAEPPAPPPAGFKRVRITNKNLPKYVGVRKFHANVTEEKDRIGLSNGLAWTEFGGELLATEVTVMSGKGKLIITGQLGEVMQESAQAALSYVRSRAQDLGLEPDFYQKLDIHVHIPEGSIPKDGPSAGITMAVAIASALTRIPVRRDLAMTGEITLRGRVLPIGGLKEKLLAAHRAKLRAVLVPKENEKDLKELPSKVAKDIRVILVEHMDQVLEQALVVEDPSKLWHRAPEAPPQPKEFSVPAQTPPDVVAH